MMETPIRQGDAARDERRGGFISLVQYDPEAVRMERLNVGVVLLLPGEAPRIRTGVSVERLLLAGVPRERVASVREDVEWFPRRFLRENPALDSPAELDRWGARLGNDILLTPARGIALRDPDAELARLFAERVEDLAAGPDLDMRLRAFFARPEVSSEIERDREVPVPELRRVRAPYAYRNGRLNLVRPIALDARAEETAGYWRLASGLLRASGDANVEVILATPHTPEQAATLAACREILAGSPAEVYEEASLEVYEAHVREALAH